MVYKVTESKDAFFLVTDGSQMDQLLTNENKQIFKSHGFELQNPPEFSAARTVVVKGVDDYISHQTEEELLRSIKINHSNINVEKIIKISNASHLLKILCTDVNTADRLVEKGISIGNQRFQGGAIEKERYTHITQCMRCYAYNHPT